MQSALIPATIISQLHGRLRFRIPQQYRHPQILEQISQQLKNHLEIYRVRTNLQTGSVTVFYGKDHSNFEQMQIVLQKTGITLQPYIKKDAFVIPGQSVAASNVSRTVTGFNQQVAKATDSFVDLRFLFPLGLSVLAIRQLITKGWMLDIIPWYVLAWYAFDSFLKLNVLQGNQTNSLD